MNPLSSPRRIPSAINKSPVRLSPPKSKEEPTYLEGSPMRISDRLKRRQTSPAQQSKKVTFEPRLAEPLFPSTDKELFPSSNQEIEGLLLENRNLLDQIKKNEEKILQLLKR